MSDLTGIDLTGSIEPWLALGLAADDEGVIRVGRVTVRFDADAARLATWPGPHGPECDGVLVRAAEPGLPSMAADHRLGATRVDHVVLMTPDLERTSAAATAVFAEPLKRVRDAGKGVHQGFFRLGEVILEIVQAPHVPEGPALLWGLVLVVDDLDTACAALGPEVIGAARTAVQAGRRIATVRSGAGLGCAVALMSD